MPATMLFNKALFITNKTQLSSVQYFLIYSSNNRGCTSETNPSVIFQISGVNRTEKKRAIECPPNRGGRPTTFRLLNK